MAIEARNPLYRTIKTVTLHPTEGDQLLEAVKDASGKGHQISYKATGEIRTEVLGFTDSEGMIFRGANDYGEVWTIVGGKLERSLGNRFLRLSLTGVPDGIGEDLYWERMTLEFEAPDYATTKVNMTSKRWPMPLALPYRMLLIEKSIIRGCLFRDPDNEGFYATYREAEIYTEAITPEGPMYAYSTQEQLPPSFPSNDTVGLEVMPRQFRQQFSDESSLVLPLVVGRGLLD